jgi:hypothetical protein
VANLSPDELDAVLEYAFQRYYDTSGLFGTPEKLARSSTRLKAIGVDEVACLLDFGVANDAVLAGLPHIATVLHQSNPPAPDTHVSAGTDTGSEVDERSLGEQLLAARPTHLQCTPSMARLIADEPAGRTALGQLPHLYVGGEALPPPLAAELRTASGGTVTNMYGPTETTIWSSAWALQPQPSSWVPIGRPIANNQCYVLDAQHQPVPPGVAGHLWIGGDGVVRGYHQRPELTAERFVAPTRSEVPRTACTSPATWPAGASWRRPDRAGVPRSQRPPGEAARLPHRARRGGGTPRAAPRVADTVAVVREDGPGDQQLVAYVVGAARRAPRPARHARRDARRSCPRYMVPSHVVELEALPRTPNGKLDRAALPPPRAATSTQVAAPPASELEAAVLAAWQRVLGRRCHRYRRQLLRHRRPLAAGGAAAPGTARAARPATGAHRPVPLPHRANVRGVAGRRPPPTTSRQALSAAIDRGARRRANLRGRT